MIALIVLLGLLAAIAIAFLLGVRIRRRELSADEAMKIGLSYHWIWACREIAWRRYGLIFQVEPVRARYD